MELFLLLKALLLALIEALTEFLPVSSTGHLILVGDALQFGREDFRAMFQIVIQLGAILAVVVVYFSFLWERFLSLLKGQKQALHFWAYLLVACFPAALLGVLFHDKIESYLFHPLPVAVGLFLGSILLLYGEKYLLPHARQSKIEDLTWKSTLRAGLGQCLALFPGVSRSAASIVGAWWGKMQTQLAAEFSFFMAIPILLGASSLSLLKFIIRRQSNQLPIYAEEKLLLLLAFFVTFFLSLLVVKAFLRFLKKYPLKYFAYYRLVLAGVVLMWMFFH